MSAHDNGGPAFPFIQVTQTEEGPFVQGNSGMSLRDYFAAQALAGFMSIPGGSDPKIDAAYAYRIADAMLAARKEGGAA